MTPESGDSGLDTIVITKFPFLVGKADAAFSRYKNKSEHGREWSYLSRRHAYIYQKDGQAYIEDLASGNGTFVDGLRLQEHAVPLQDGVVVAFGGKHFAYRVGITRESGVEPAPSVARAPMAEGVPAATVASPPIAGSMPAEAPPSDRTKFMAAPTSFLEIFCDADEPKDDVEPADSAASRCRRQGAGGQAPPARPRRCCCCPSSLRSLPAASPIAFGEAGGRLQPSRGSWARSS